MLLLNKKEEENTQTSRKAHRPFECKRHANDPISYRLGLAMMNNCLVILDKISEKLLQDLLAAEEELPDRFEKAIIPSPVFGI